MAHAYEHTGIITEDVVITVDREVMTVVLELTPDEAQVLRDILEWGVTGHDSSRRGLTTNVWEALTPLTDGRKPTDMLGTILFECKE